MQMDLSKSQNKCRWICQTCTFENPPSTPDCEICGSSSSDEDTNRRNNGRRTKRKPSSATPKDLPKRECPICELQIPGLELELEGESSPIQCQGRPGGRQSGLVVKGKHNQSSCGTCFEWQSIRRTNGHLRSCEKNAFEDTTVTIIDEDDRVRQCSNKISEKQRICLNNVQMKAYQRSEQMRSSLENRLVQLGFCKQDVTPLENYFRDHVPLCITFDAGVSLPMWNDENRLKNSTEIYGKCNQCVKWEKSMFFGSYDYAYPAERPHSGITSVGLG
eukprot:CAMPEP_0115001882 /NCGR_PEP_ID=MMETSP0216-20121206/17671_1 /TAXON_ID=223996 /ORGANISM="Protocruzia adherens, Strain Boccale" /LENGTH=274 /DNA_ID=CAMNT_0002367363 /DNA_START=467 /DNA_END=1287 /DNA_ORIENTATION=-